MKKFIVEKQKLIENIRNIKNKACDTEIIAVLKGNGYGLGLIEFATVLLEHGITFFAVSDISEAVSLREAGFENELLLLSSTSLKSETDLIIKYDITASVGTLTTIETLNQSAKEFDKKVRVHIKADSGFGRFGFMPNQYQDAINSLKKSENIEVCGLFSHFSFSFAKNRKYVDKQLAVFKRAIDVFSDAGLNVKIKHIANSSAFIKYPDTYFDAVRIGSAFLGRVIDSGGLSLNRIGYLESQVTEIKKLPKGHNIGYANTYTTKRETKVAVVSVGYTDGFGVERSKDTFRFRDMLRYIYGDIMICLRTKHLQVKIDDNLYNLLGRVGMYNLVINITGTNVIVGDKVKIDINPLFCDSGILREYI